MFRTALKSLLAHKVRMALTALSVVLGVGFVAGTYVLTDTINATFDQLFRDVNAGTDVFVRSSAAFESQVQLTRKPVDEDLLDVVAAVPGVAEADGTLQGFAQLIDKEGEAIIPTGPPTLGVNWSDTSLNPLTMRSGEPPRASGEVAIDAATARLHEFELGDRIRVIFQGPPSTFTVTGVVGFGDADNLAGATLAVFETETAQRVLDREGSFDTIAVGGEEDVPVETLRARVAEVLPDGVEAETATDVSQEASDALQEQLGFLTVALLVFGFIGVFVGAFIIFNTFSVIVAQRTREFGLLRALGASGRQVMGTVLIESVLVGLLGSVIGLGVGVLLALGLQGLLQAFGLDLPSTALQLKPRTVVAAFAVGTIVTIVASLLPARRAARVTPMEALREAAPVTPRFSRRRLLIGLVLFAGGMAALLTGLFGGVENAAAVVGVGAYVVFTAVAVLSPLFVGPLARGLGAAPARFAGLPGRLARDNAARNPRRTSTTAAALMIGLALVGMVGILGASIKESTTVALERGLRAEFVVTSGSFTGLPTLTPEVATRLDRLPEVGAVTEMRLGDFRITGDTDFLVAVDEDTLDDVMDIGVASGSLADLDDGSVFVAVAVAEDRGLTPGDRVRLRFPATGTQTFSVAGTFEETGIAGGNWIVTLGTYEENYAEKLDFQVLVKLREGVGVDEGRLAIERALQDFPSAELQNQAEYAEQTAAQVDQLLALVTALLGLALVIALLGITNTLALAVFERTREIGLLRAVGMSRRQARRMIRWEAVIVAVIGALLGIAVGILFGWALTRSLAEEGIGELRVPGGQLAIYVALAGLAGVVAAIPPARRAARLDVLEAIATE